MQTRKTLPLLLLVAIFILASCSSPVTPEPMMEKDPTPTEAMMEKGDTMALESTATSEPMMDGEKEGDEAMADEQKDGSSMDDTSMMEEKQDDATMDTPAWFDVSLTNVQTGEAFTINELKGKVVLVENLAQWCSNCKKQQQQVIELAGLLGDSADVVLLGLDIDPNATDKSLQAYIQSNGFTWWYAVAPVEVTHEISQTLGDQFLNPPSTPMFIIDRHGEIHPLGFGIKSAADLYDALQPFVDGDM